jgi:hypothetical protein
LNIKSEKIYSSLKNTEGLFMATLHEIEVIIAEFTEKYRREEFSKIRKSRVYKLSPDQSTTNNNEYCWPQTWPNNDYPGVYAILSGDEVLYIGKASLQILGYRLSSYFKYSKDRKSAVPNTSHVWSKPPTGVVTWAVPHELFFEASALEEFLIYKLKDKLPDNRVGTGKWK